LVSVSHPGTPRSRRRPLGASALARATSPSRSPSRSTRPTS